MDLERLVTMVRETISFNFDLGVLILLVVVAIELRSQRRRDVAQAKRDQRSASIEVYQRLELASNEVFRFEADHVDLIRPLYSGHGAPTEIGRQHAYYGYVNQILNLFEMQVELYCNDIVDVSTLGTWVAWFNELARAPGFRDVWEDGVREEYSARLAELIDLTMASEEPLTLEQAKELLDR